jgi:hypothetical protein
MSGVDIQTVKDLMGHSSITTTAIHLHTEPKHRREAVAKFSHCRQLHRQFRFRLFLFSSPVLTSLCYVFVTGTRIIQVALDRFMA